LLAPLEIGRRPKEPALCRMTWARKKNAEGVIRELSNWSFRGGLAFTNDGYLRFDSRSQRRLGSDFEWRIRLDEADLRFSLSRAADRCWLIRSIVPHGPRIIEQVSAGDNSFTFDLDPGNADKVIVYYGVGGESQPVSIARKHVLGEPFSVSRGPDFPPRNDDLPAFALAITYRNGNMLSAEYRLFEMPEPGS
jgi:hypothetical protein